MPNETINERQREKTVRAITQEDKKKGREVYMILPENEDTQHAWVERKVPPSRLLANVKAREGCIMGEKGEKSKKEGKQKQKTLQ